GDGHAVTLFNRGTTDPSDARRMEMVRGDREHDLARLGERQWDAVVDTSAYLPKTVETSARFFSERARRYVFVSTISVHDFSVAPIREETPLLRLADDASHTEMTPETYGALKVLCESVVASTYRDRCAILRPSLVAGPYDPTDRFTYWVVRIARGGMVLAPENPQMKTQFCDARDLAEFCAQVVRDEIPGEFEVAGVRTTFGDLFETCKRIARSDPDFVWADADFLARSEVRPWADFPLWVPASAGIPGVIHIDTRRAKAAGLKTRPLSDTVRDTLTWALNRPKDHAWLAGLTAQREGELIEAYAAKPFDPVG
nr:epimerase [Candidatus Eremiobacteraeota bacterium]